jgi:hypothetical protein
MMLMIIMMMIIMMTMMMLILMMMKMMMVIDDDHDVGLDYEHQHDYYYIYIYNIYMYICIYVQQYVYCVYGNSLPCPYPPSGGVGWVKSTRSKLCCKTEHARARTQVHTLRCGTLRLHIGLFVRSRLLDQ